MNFKNRRLVVSVNFIVSDYDIVLGGKECSTLVRLLTTFFTSMLTGVRAM